MSGKGEYSVLLIPLLLIDVCPLIVERINGSNAECAPTPPDCVLDVGAPFIDSFPRSDEQVAGSLSLRAHVYAERPDGQSQPCLQPDGSASSVACLLRENLLATFHHGIELLATSGPGENSINHVLNLGADSTK